MKLGSLELARHEPDGFVCATVVRSFQNAKEPGRSLVLLAAVGLFCKGPKDWPTFRADESFDVFGERMRAYLNAHGIDAAQACTLGIMAIRHATKATTLEERMVDDFADFFGVDLDTDNGSNSPHGTKDQPSEG